MRVFASLLIKLFSYDLTQQVVILGLEKAVARTNNTVDDQVVSIVRQALGNRVNPIQRVVGK